jgi:hypothetical protein
MALAFCVPHDPSGAFLVKSSATTCVKPGMAPGIGTPDGDAAGAAAAGGCVVGAAVVGAAVVRGAVTRGAPVVLGAPVVEGEPVVDGAPVVEGAPVVDEFASANDVEVELREWCRPLVVDVTRSVVDVLLDELLEVELLPNCTRPRLPWMSRESWALR